MGMREWGEEREREREREREGERERGGVYSNGLLRAVSTVRDDKLINCHPEAPRRTNVLLNSVKN